MGSGLKFHKVEATALKSHKVEATAKQVIRTTIVRVQWLEEGMHNTISDLRTGSQSQMLKLQVIRTTIVRVQWLEEEMHNTTRDLRTGSQTQMIKLIAQKELNSNRSSTEGIIRGQQTRRAVDRGSILARSTLHNRDGDLIQLNLAKKSEIMIREQRSMTY